MLLTPLSARRPSRSLLGVVLQWFRRHYAMAMLFGQRPLLDSRLRRTRFKFSGRIKLILQSLLHHCRRVFLNLSVQFRLAFPLSMCSLRRPHAFSPCSHLLLILCVSCVPICTPVLMPSSRTLSHAHHLAHIKSKHTTFSLTVPEARMCSTLPGHRHGLL